MGAARNFVAVSSLAMVLGGGAAVVHGAEQMASKVEAIFTDCTDDVFTENTYSYNQPQPCDFAVHPEFAMNQIAGSAVMPNLLGSIAIGAGYALIIGRLQGGEDSFPNRRIWAKNPKPLK